MILPTDSIDKIVQNSKLYSYTGKRTLVLKSINHITVVRNVIPITI